ncbi:hypothetical protein ASG88_12785 [Nocardioides sp. Soil777]|uniref:DUF2252 domain-containing protein n=1 Tax=Nocardioides sp. Soil777 TaxID=1736409 RepID=UPI0007028D94|nr:DUF2252 domain-containing protein [Nocardioides sp. Soil777]KRF00244.1 hypothetical protein ASG88_12785 [Nocardioides sp. Soil777]
MTTADPVDRALVGTRARARVPPEAHAELDTTDRPGAVRVLAGQIPTRVPELVPIRHERMMTSPFAFFRGSAAVMAHDLAGSPVSGLDVQLCGDAHLDNFGLFASPERSLLFDINDFDETCPGPWEWDLKRLAASLVVAGRENDFTDRDNRDVVVAGVRRYANAMATFAGMGNLALWYSRIDADEAKELLGERLDKRGRKRLDKSLAKARSRNHLRSLDKMTRVVDGERRIVADPPVVVPVADLAPGLGRDEIEHTVQAVLADYASSLEPGLRELVRSYSFVDMARIASGVGSVGTRCWVTLMRGRDEDDPLFLQVKQAQQSVLAGPLGRDDTGHQGRRVVTGQRIMQAAGDAFLGWQRTTGIDGVERDFYVRQLHDWKGSAKVETMDPAMLAMYAELCGWTLARAHARSGDRIAIAAYLGDDDALPDALAEYAAAYADLNERDYATFGESLAAGELDMQPAGSP